jgi:hypothetical protein
MRVIGDIPVSHCVYNAFVQHMHHLGEPAYQSTWDVYHQRKSAAQDVNAYTYAGIVPWLYWEMLLSHNIRSPRRFELEIQTSYVHPKEYIDEGTARQKFVIRHLTKYAGYYVDKIDLQPAIYCALTPTRPDVMVSNHAFFQEEIPDGVRLIMAIRIFEQLSEQQEAHND